MYITHSHNPYIGTNVNSHMLPAVTPISIDVHGCSLKGNTPLGLTGDYFLVNGLCQGARGPALTLSYIEVTFFAGRTTNRLSTLKVASIKSISLSI